MRSALVATSLLCACATSPAQTTVPYVVERIEAPAPAAPRRCSERGRARATLYVFTADWCRACERWLAQLEQQRNALAHRGVEVRQVVTGEGSSCMNAARIAARVSFGFDAASSDVERAWQVRSTPTSWLIDARGTRLYIEGVLPPERLMAAIDESLR